MKYYCTNCNEEITEEELENEFLFRCELCEVEMNITFHLQYDRDSD